jgi:carboxymethylenebutenolidase
MRALGAFVAMSALQLANAAAPAVGDAPGSRAPTWAQMQETQSWATQNLARSPHHQEWVRISNSGRSLKAWLAYPNARKRLPVVLVLHEVFGLTDSTRYTADEIAMPRRLART